LKFSKNLINSSIFKVSIKNVKGFYVNNIMGEEDFQYGKRN